MSTSRPNIPTPKLAALLLGAVLIAGCADDADPARSSAPSAPSSDPAASSSSAPPEGPVLAADDLATRVRDEYAEASSVACAGELVAEAGATQDCIATADGKDVGVRATATEVDGEDVTLDYTPFLTGERVSATVAESLSAQGYTGAGGTCESVLVGVVGKTTTCEMVTDDFTTPVVATVTGVVGLTVDFSFEN